jgi:hypothetical protein
MSSATAAAKASPAQRHRVHKGRRIVPGPDSRVDTLLGMVLALTSELAVLRERLDAHERLAAQGKLAAPETVNVYEPDEAAQRERAAQRQRLLDKVCRPLLAVSADRHNSTGSDANE